MYIMKGSKGPSWSESKKAATLILELDWALPYPIPSCPVMSYPVYSYIYPSIHPSVHPSIHPAIHSPLRSDSCQMLATLGDSEAKFHETLHDTGHLTWLWNIIILSTFNRYYPISKCDIFLVMQGFWVVTSVAGKRVCLKIDKKAFLPTTNCNVIGKVMINQLI